MNVTLGMKFITIKRKKMTPELSDVMIKDGDTVAVDLETYDPELKTHGSGAIRNKGRVVGIAIAYKEQKFYSAPFSIRNE